MLWILTALTAVSGVIMLRFYPEASRKSLLEENFKDSEKDEEY